MEPSFYHYAATLNIMSGQKHFSPPDKCSPPDKWKQAITEWFQFCDLVRMDTDIVCCDCRDLAAIGRISAGGSARHAVTAVILLPLDVSVLVGRPGMNINITKYVWLNHVLGHVVGTSSITRCI